VVEHSCLNSHRRRPVAHIHAEVYIKLSYQSGGCGKSCGSKPVSNRFTSDFGYVKIQGRKEGIRIFVQDNLEEGISKERILEKLERRFSVSAEMAETYYQKFSVVS